MTPSVDPATPPYSGSEPPPEIGLLTILEIILRRRYMIALFAIVIIIAILIATRPKGTLYSSEGSFTPQSSRAPSAVMGLAQQFGVPLSGDANQSPDFYVDLLTSREILQGVADSTYDFHVDGRPKRQTLLQRWGGSDTSLIQRHAAAVGRLHKAVSAAVDARTNVINVTVRTDSPDLSKGILERLLAELNAFNVGRRQSQAAAERRFAEQRMADAKAELNRAEGLLLDFRERNREARAPNLSFDEDRLSREVVRLQAIYNGLSQSYEQSRLEEVRDTPVLTTIERPSDPTGPDATTSIPKKILIGLMLGLMTGAFTAVLFEFLTTTPGARAEEHRLSVAWHETLDDLRDPIGAFKRRSRRTKRTTLA